MLLRETCVEADSMGLLWNPERIRDAKETIKEGPEARWWLSTRLLLGLSQEEALRVRKALKRKPLDNQHNLVLP